MKFRSWDERALAAEYRIARALAMLDGLRREHPATCPRAHNDDDACWCGADAQAALVDAIAAALRGEA